MTSDKEARVVAPKGRSDDIVVVTVKHSWSDWLMVILAGVVVALLGGLGVHWLIG